MKPTADLRKVNCGVGSLSVPQTNRSSTAPLRSSASPSNPDRCRHWGTTPESSGRRVARSTPRGV